MKISVCIICGDEEKNIRRALESSKWADEIVVVDHISKDKTYDIVKEYTDKVYQRAWTGFIDQKNYVLSLAKGEWIFSLDSDEEITEDLKNEIMTIINSKNTKDGYYVPRRSFFQGRWINHSGFYPDKQLRLFKRTKAKWGGQRVHEKIEIDGELGILKNDLLHYPFEGNIEEFEQTLNRYSTLQAKNLYDQGKRFNLFLLFARPFFKFLEIYILKMGFLDGIAGFFIAKISSHAMFLRYAKLREIEKGFVEK